jgi:DNA repair protein RAD7
MDFSLDDETIEVMSKSCTGLRRLKLEDCWKMSDRSLQAIANLQSLEYLSLNLISETQTENLLELVSKIGSNLRTLSLRGFSLADDTVLEMIHDKCKVLTKLRFTDNSICTDKGFAKLFDNWSNPPLEFALRMQLDSRQMASLPLCVTLAPCYESSISLRVATSLMPLSTTCLRMVKVTLI